MPINQDHKIFQRQKTFEVKETPWFQAMNLPSHFFRCRVLWSFLFSSEVFWFWFNDSFSSLPICLHQQIVFSSKTPFVARDLLDKLSRQILVMENIAEISTENLGNITSLTDGKRQVRGFPSEKCSFGHTFLLK